MIEITIQGRRNIRNLHIRDRELAHRALRGLNFVMSGMYQNIASRMQHSVRLIASNFISKDHPENLGELLYGF